MIATKIDSFTGTERPVIRFAVFQLFAVIYLQKFAVPGLSVGANGAQVNLAMLLMILGLVWMISLGRLQLSAIRLGCYCTFITLCLASEIICGDVGSVPSFIELIVICSYMTVTADLSERGYRYVMDKFIKFMIVPAIIVLIQYSIQKIMGGGDPISLDKWLTKTSTFLYQGYYYEAGYPVWNSVFQRPNGLFFLEPSFVSMFMATAAILEMIYFGRKQIIGLLILATALSFGGTGLMMLIMALPFLLMRTSPRTACTIVGLGVIALMIATSLGMQLPFISRLGEFENDNASAGARVTLPAVQFIALVLDPAYLLSGTGAGSITNDYGNAWAIVKLTKEYGVLSMLAFVALYSACMFRKSNFALKVVLTIIFQFTGGYLLNPVVLEMIVLLCVIIPPATVSKFSSEDYLRMRHAGAPA